MGYLARQLLQSERPALIQALIQAYADERFAHYNYWLVANTVCGPASPGVVALLRRKAQRSLVHANRLAPRLSELGNCPVATLTELVQHATAKPFKLPDDLRDLDGALKAALDAGRTGTTLRPYQRLYEQTREHDPVTQALALALLTEAVHGEEPLERLLDESAAERAGQGSRPRRASTVLQQENCPPHFRWDEEEPVDSRRRDSPRES